MGSGYSKMKKQAKMFGQQFNKMQEELKGVEVTGEAGNGLVKVLLTGDKKLKKITISKECVDPDDIEGLEDLIQAAFNEALDKTEDSNPMNQLSGSLPFSL
jgi:DNA-binding YbaB/EbfC family protein